MAAAPAPAPVAAAAGAGAAARARDASRLEPLVSFFFSFSLFQLPNVFF
jgi:hypothetical protein